MLYTFSNRHIKELRENAGPHASIEVPGLEGFPHVFPGAEHTIVGNCKCETFFFLEVKVSKNSYFKNK